MSLERLDLNHLVVLNALLAESSVSRAAQRVHLSQPAVSWALAKLRSFFGDPLLVREGRLMVLTPSAKAMVAPLRELLDQIDGVASAAPTFDPAAVARVLRAETSDYLLTELLPQVVAECAHVAPRLGFEFAMLGAQSQDRLERGEIDIVIAPKPLASPKHPATPLFRDTYSCLAWRGNRKIGTALSRADFLGCGHVATDWSGGLVTTAEERIFGKLGERRRVEVSVSHYTMIPRFLVGTELIATVQTRLAMRVAASAPLRVLPCPVRLPALEEVIQCHRFQERDPVITWFTERLLSSVAAMPRRGAARRV
jgi:LysR family transcriptional regulator, nod-box dependent transcriptional activator